MEFASCVVLTSSEFGPDVMRWKAENPEAPVDFVVVGEGAIAERMRWHRIARFSAYLLWLRRASAEARRIHASVPFDAALHATYSAYWLPSPAVDLGIPNVWGPVGGQVTTPFPLWRELGYGGIAGEILDLLAVRTARLLPSTRRTWRRATVRLLNNEETLRAIPPDLPGRSIVLNNAPFTTIEPARSRRRQQYVVFPSPLDPRKGPRLALKAFALAHPSLRLVFAAGGIEQRPLERMARRLGVSDRVDFHGWIPRTAMMELLAGAGAAIFTGLREEGGVALTEAMLHGTPVIALDHGGARTILSTTTDRARVAPIRPSSPLRTARAIAAAIDRFCLDPVDTVGPTLDQDAYRGVLRGAFEVALARSLDSGVGSDSGMSSG
jgi:glycosyltransferase involved in cell wall biosynthesis